MGAGRRVGWSLLALGTACATSHPETRGAQAGAASHEAARDASRRYVDEELGFELTRPGEDWQLDATHEASPEGLLTPVVLRHQASGAQVVLQVAPAVASPTQLAERMTEGLSTQHGFRTTEPAPLAFSEGAVGFDFSVDDAVQGRVAVREGSEGQLFMLLATWPTGSSAEVAQGVDALFRSVHPLVRGH